MARQSVFLGILAVATLAALGGCKSQRLYEDQFQFETPADVAERHPIYVDKTSNGMSLKVAARASGLSQAQKAELRRFVRNYRAQGDSAFSVRAPSGSANETATVRALDDVHDVLYEAGVSPGAVRFDTYAAYGKTAPAIRISFGSATAVGPDCGSWPKDVSRDRLDRPYENFGCATQANLAAMVANPRDLEQPRGTTPRSSERRDTTWDKYVKGDVTAAERSEQEKKAASDVKSGG